MKGDPTPAAVAYDTLAALLRTGLSERDDALTRAQMDPLWWEMTDRERRARTPHVPPRREAKADPFDVPVTAETLNRRTD